MGRADLANKTQIEALINTLHSKSHLDEALQKADLGLETKQVFQKIKEGRNS
jgi:hypothetical protein